MKLLKFSLVLLVFLSSCSNVTVTPSATVTLTAASTATLTATPSPYPKTETAAPTNTPEGLKIPELTKEKLAVIDWADFTPATWEDIGKLRDYILKNPALVNINVQPMNIYPSEIGDGMTYVQSSCNVDVNCAARFAVSMEMPSGEEAHLLIMEAIVRKPDGTNNRIVLTLSKDPQHATQKWKDSMLEQIRRFSIALSEPGLRILIKADNLSYFKNPLIPDIVDSSSGPFDPIRQAAGSGYFDENTWKTILWIMTQTR